MCMSAQTVPPAPPDPKMALLPSALVQVTLLEPSHQNRLVVSQLPVPSDGLGAVEPLGSQVRVAACTVARDRVSTRRSTARRAVASEAGSIAKMLEHSGVEGEIGLTQFVATAMAGREER